VRGQIWWMYFVFMYENRIMNPVVIVLRRGGGIRENDGRLNLFKIYCNHICKYHNVSHCKTILINK
jgi:hypothetical protein